MCAYVKSSTDFTQKYLLLLKAEKIEAVVFKNAESEAAFQEVQIGH